MNCHEISYMHMAQVERLLAREFRILTHHLGFFELERY